MKSVTLGNPRPKRFFQVLVLIALCVTTGAQDPDCRTPDGQALSTAWPQNTTVTVNINSNPGHFSQADFDCLKDAFDNWNTANGANGANHSGVTFNVNFSSTVLVQTTSNGQQVTSAASGSVYQINRSTVGISGIGVGATGGQGTSSNRINAFTNIHPNVTNCTALVQTMAHEIGHTTGLGECSSCSAIGNDWDGLRNVRCQWKLHCSRLQ